MTSFDFTFGGVVGRQEASDLEQMALEFEALENKVLELQKVIDSGNEAFRQVRDQWLEERTFLRDTMNLVAKELRYYGGADADERDGLRDLIQTLEVAVHAPASWATLDKVNF